MENNFLFIKFIAMKLNIILPINILPCCQISDSGLFCDTECTAEIESNNCQSPVSQSQAAASEQVQSPVSHNCVPSDAVQPQRKRKSETECCLPCKKLNPEEKPHTM